ncbi:MAG: AMP-binding protein [Desulfobacterales bacterium]
MIEDLQFNVMRRFCVGDIFRRVALNKPNKEAIIYSYKGSTVGSATYGELNRRANRFADAVLKAGIQKGDRVAIISYNCIQYVVYIIAMSKIGAWITPINYALKGREIELLINHSKPKMVIVEDELIPQVLELQNELPDVDRFVMIDLNGETPLPEGWHDFDDMCSEAYSDAEPYMMINGDDVLTLMYTSGTEAMPKGVMNTHANWHASIMNSFIDFGSFVREDSTALGVVPLFHVAGHSSLFGNMAAGSKTIMLHRPDPPLVMKAFEEFTITDANLAPTVLANLLHMPGGDKLIQRLFGSLRMVNLYGSPTTDALMEKIMQLLPDASFQNYYGQSEMTPLGTTLKSPDLLRKMRESAVRFDGASAIGQSHAMVEMKIVDENDQELPPGEIGEMVARSPSVMQGYYKEEQKTAETFRNGWHHTGDLAVMDEERFFYFVDRKKDMVKTGAENVSSVEVEQWIARHPKVAEVAVVGIPHPRWMEAVTAFVVPVHGESISGDEVLSFCKEGLAGYKVPKKVITVAELPKLPSGKVLKRNLRTGYNEVYQE